MASTPDWFPGRREFQLEMAKIRTGVLQVKAAAWGVPPGRMYRARRLYHGGGPNPYGGQERPAVAGYHGPVQGGVRGPYGKDAVHQKPQFPQPALNGRGLRGAAAERARHDPFAAREARGADDRGNRAVGHGDAVPQAALRTGDGKPRGRPYGHGIPDTGKTAYFAIRIGNGNKEYGLWRPIFSAH